MAEARIVAVLLTDVVSSTQHLTHLGDEAGNAQRVRHFELLRECLARHGGQEVKNTGDGLLAVFASAVDAVRCATTMQQCVHADRLAHPDDGVEMKVGLHLGEPVQAEDDFFGAPMVLVTRLCSAAAPGQIVVSELLRTLVAAKHELSFEPIGELELKGLEAPVRAWSVPWQPVAGTTHAASDTFHAPLAAPVGRAAFVDRVQERAELARWYDRARRGQRVLGLVGGEPGVGKSRLVAEFARGAHESGATVLWGRCFEEAYVAHAPFVEALRAVFEWCCDLDVPVPGIEAAGRHLCELAPSFAPPCASGSAETTLARSTTRSAHEQGADRLRFFDAVDRVIIELCAVTPVVLVLDDLQWADEDTLQLLSHLVRSPEADRLLILGTYRDTEVDRGRPLSRTLADLRRERREHRLRLSGLDGAGVDDLVAELADDRLDEDTVRAVADRTDGNPFLIEEVVSHLLESSDDDVAHGVPADAALPDGVREVIGRRLSRLSPVVESVLTVAAVIGREFSLDLLEPLLDVGRDELLDALDAALRAGLVREVGDRPGRYGFAHGLAREALVEELSATRRARLHQRIAERLEATEPPPDDEVRPAWTAEVAHHALAAVPLLDPLRAVGHVADAGEQALAELAYERAADLYDTAADTLESSAVPTSHRPLRARIRLGAGTAHVLAGHGPAARAAFRACIDDAAELGDAALRARATLGLGTAVGSGVGFEFGVFNDELVELLRAALEDLPGGDTELRARLTARLGSAHGFSSDPAHGIALCREASAMAERLGDPATIAACCNDLRAAAWSRVDPDEQQRLSDRVVDLAVAADEPLIELQGRVWQVCDAMERGRDADQVERVVDAMAQLVERLRLPQYRWYLELFAANRALLDGDVTAAEHHSVSALEVGTPMGETNVELAFGAATYLQHVERNQVASLVPLAAEQARRFPALPAWRAVHAQALAASGDVAGAVELAHATLAALHDTPVDPLRQITLALLVDVAARGDDVGLAAQLADLLEPDEDRWATVAQMVGNFGAVAHHLGVAAAVAGRPDRAVAALELAVARHRAMRAPVWQARSLIELAEVLERRGGHDDLERAGDARRDAADIATALDRPELLCRAEVPTVVDELAVG